MIAAARGVKYTPLQSVHKHSINSSMQLKRILLRQCDAAARRRVVQNMGTLNGN